LDPYARKGKVDVDAALAFIKAAQESLGAIHDDVVETASSLPTSQSRLYPEVMRIATRLSEIEHDMEIASSRISRLKDTVAA
jgi:hypothetical protein